MSVKTSLIPSVGHLHFWALVVCMVDVAFVRISELSLVSFGQYSCNFVKTRVYVLNCTDMHVLDSSCRYERVFLCTGFIYELEKCVFGMIVSEVS